MNFGALGPARDIIARLARLARAPEMLSIKEVVLSSAATVDIGSVQSSSVLIEGAVSIVAFTAVPNKRRNVRFSGVPLLTHNATSLILPGGANIQAIAGDAAVFESDASGNWRCVRYTQATYAPFAGKLIKVTVFTASGTWTRSAGCRTVVAEVIAGGGSGGGVGAAGASTLGASSGGSGGGYSLKRVTAPGATETVTVGDGGAVPTAGVNAGNGGGVSSFGSHCSATGGAGGNASTPTGSGAAAGVDGGIGSSGDLNLQGGPSNHGVWLNGSYALGGTGGNAARGGGGGRGTNVSSGSAGGIYGGGGAGSANNNNGAAVAGAAGANGIVIVWEYE